MPSYATSQMTDEDLEYGGLTAGLILVAVLSLVSYFVGLNVGGVFAGLAGFGLFLAIYAFQPGIQSFKTGFFIGIVGYIIFGFLLEPVMPFGQMWYNLMVSGQLAGELGGGISIAGTIFLDGFAIYYVKIPDGT